MNKFLVISAVLLATPLQGSETDIFEAGLIFHHDGDCALQAATCDTDPEGNGACIYWVAPYTPSAFRLHASAAADGSRSWKVFFFDVDDGYSHLDYQYVVPYSAWREVRLDADYSACQLYAHFPVIHKWFGTRAVAGAATDYNFGELRTEALVGPLRFSGTELGELVIGSLAHAYCELPYGCLPDDGGDCARYCVPDDESDIKTVERFVSTENLWTQPAAGPFVLEDIDGLLVEYFPSYASNVGACEELPLFEIDLSLAAGSQGWPGQAGVDGGEALACFGAYGNLSNFNYVECPGWNGGPNDPVPPGGAGIRVFGRADQAGIDTEEGPQVISVPIRLLWSEEDLSGWEVVDPDADCDGIIDDDDRCPMTPASSSINEFGCTASQYIELMCGMIDCGQEHGRYVSCVTDTVNKVVDQGLIFKNEKGRFIRQAARCE